MDVGIFAYQTEPTMKSTITTEQAMDHLRNALKDESYRLVWEANIAMAFKDQWAFTKQEEGETESKYIHRIANRAAAAFIDQLTGKDLGDVDGMAAVAKLHQQANPLQS